MEVVLLPDALDDLKSWQKSGNKAIQKKIVELIKSIQDSPFDGIGKPEALKHSLTGKWSRRINSEHRIVYLVEENTIYIYSLKGHY
ncbi:Txe/YoeB family addiction module toxin [Mucilaginibacter terrae]|uniref:Txe/YoeB family addiction module toxin n=1 Tax=Mucilaginibacter terrae TaxID=1955052 RepID=UPI00363BC4F8